MIQQLRFGRLSFTLLPLVFASLLAACGAAQQPVEVGEEICAICVPEDRNTHAVVWTQTSAEYAAVAQTVYRAAQATLPMAIEDPEWSAVVEQQDDDFAELPPAIILDLDETVLDNSPYQAWLIATGQSFDSETWDQWCLDAVAPVIPGALDFLDYAQELGVEIFYVSNRAALSEEATIENLRALGLETDPEHVLLKGEFEGGSEKGVRREAIIDRYRVIMLFGDNLGDFVDGVDVGLEARDEIVAEYGDWWSVRWFMLPNPQYGSWVPAATGGSYDYAPLLDVMYIWEPAMDAQRADDGTLSTEP